MFNPRGMVPSFMAPSALGGAPIEGDNPSDQPPLIFMEEGVSIERLGVMAIIAHVQMFPRSHPSNFNMIGLGKRPLRLHETKT